MNDQYEAIKSSLEEVGCPESYIQKGLTELGFESFPESGLSDKGRSKLLQTISEVYNSEADLSLRNYKTKIIKKEGKPKKRAKNLEGEILREDLRRIGEVMPKIAKAITYIAKAIIYPTLGVNLALPTMMRKAIDYDGGTMSVTIFGAVAGAMITYTTLAYTNPKLIVPAILTQVGTNLVSGVYEWNRSIRKRAEEKRSDQAKIGIEYLRRD